MSRTLLTVALVALSIVAFRAPAETDDPVLAKTDAGQVSLADLNGQLKRMGLTPERLDLESEEGCGQIERLVRQLAAEQVLLAEAEKLGAGEDASLQAQLALARPQALLERARGVLIMSEVAALEEEFEAYLRQRMEEIELPATASWRFMMFAKSEDGSDEEVRKGALEARNRVLKGSAFEEIAREMATAPVQGEAGALIGPFEFEGKLDPAMEAFVRDSKLGTVSEPFETETGYILLQVESRDLDPKPRENWLRFHEGGKWKREKREEVQKKLLGVLREKYAVEYSVPEDVPTAPDDHVVIDVGGGKLTMGDLRSRAQLMGGAGPSRVESMLGEEQLEQEADNLLLVRELEERAPEEVKAVDEQIEINKRSMILNWARAKVSQEFAVTPEPGEIEEIYREHGEDFERSVFDLKVMRISFPTFAELTGSTSKHVYYRKANEYVELLRAGAEMEDIAEELPGWPREQDSITNYEGATARQFDRETNLHISSLDEGQIGDPLVGTEGIAIVHLEKRGTEIPPLEELQGELRRLWHADHGPQQSFEERLMKDYGFEVVADLESLTWSDKEVLVFQPADTTDAE